MATDLPNAANHHIDQYGHKSGSKRSDSGYTLVEMLVVVTIAAILGMVAIPALTEARQAMARKSATSALLVSLQWARFEALQRASRMVVCKSGDGVRCAQSGNWEQGWIVFQDANGNAAIDDGELPLLRQGAMAGVRIVGDSAVGKYVTFDNIGGSVYTNNAFQAGAFTACAISNKSVESRKIVLSKGGRVRIQVGELMTCS